MTARRELVVDWVRCAGHGVCAELLPELVELDDWGYPQVLGPVPERLLRLAERARASCPAIALRLVETPETTAPGLPLRRP
jgi:ferredoxin